MNNTIRKYPRTLTEAFGPYAEFHEPKEWPITLLSFVITVAAIALIIVCLYTP